MYLRQVETNATEIYSIWGRYVFIVEYLKLYKNIVEYNYGIILNE